MADGSITLTVTPDLSKVKDLDKALSTTLKNGDTKLAGLIQSFQKANNAVEQQTVKVQELRQQLDGLKSGDVAVKTTETTKLQKDFDGVTQSIENTKNKIAELYSQLDQLQMNAFKSPDTGEPVLGKADQAEFDKINVQLTELETKLEKDRQKATDLGQGLRDAVGEATQQKISQTTEQLNRAETKLEQLTNQANIAGTKLQQSGTKMADVTEGISKGFEKVTKRISGLVKRVLFFSLITMGLRTLRNAFGEILMTNDQFSQSVEQLKMSLYMLATPIYEAVLPALTAFLQFLSKVIVGIATFIYALQGKSYAQLIKNTKALRQQTVAHKKSASAKKSDAQAQKELNKQLAAFDDLIILQEEKQQNYGTAAGGGGAGGGGAGGGGAGGGIIPEFDENDFSVAEKIGKWAAEHKNLLLAAAALGGVGLAISKLLPLFRKKDRGLDTQSQKTETETSLVKQLARAFSNAVVPVGALANAFVFNLSPAFQTATDKGYGLLPAFDGAKQSACNLSPAFQTVTDKGYGLLPAFDGAKQSAYNLSPALDGATSSAENLSPAFQTATDKMSAFDIVSKAVMPAIETVIATAMNNSRQNIKNFCTDAKENFSSWAKNLQTNAIDTAKVVANNVYSAFSSAGENITEFINTTSTNFATWATNMAKNMATMAKNIATNFGSGLSSAWDNFKNFMSATGEKISGFWRENKAKIITVGAMTGLAVAGVALAPYTGGLSLAIPALAQGAVLPPNKPFLAMVGDQKSGTNIEAPLATIVEAMNIALQGQRQTYGNTEVVLEIDGREFGRAVVEQGNRESRRIGTRLVLV